MLTIAMTLAVSGMYVRTIGRIRAYIYVCMYVYMDVCMYMCVCVCVYVCMLVCIYMYVCMHV